MNLFNAEIPQDLFNVITLNMTICFFLALLYMTYTDGQVTIRYYDEIAGTKTAMDELIYKPIAINGINYTSINQRYDFADHFRTYRNDLSIQGIRIQYINYYLFYFGLPLINYVYIAWCFRRGLMWLPKNIYTRIYSKNWGEF